LSRFPRLPKSTGDRRGSVAVEFAIVVGILFSVIFGALQLGLLFWTRSTLQMTAFMTARCVAIGSCSNPTTYAQSLASSAAGVNIPANGSVTVSTGSCYGSSTSYSGYTSVTISAPFWSNALVGPIPGTTVTVTACYTSPA
jgi:Flp pilus assembly protein TadG